MEIKNLRKIRIYPIDTGIASQNITYEVGNSDFVGINVISLGSLVFTDNFTIISQPSSHFQDEINPYKGGFRIRFTQSASANMIYELKIANIPSTDNEKISNSTDNRLEVWNENDVLIAENNKPFKNGTFPSYSKNYWKNPPSLAADATQDDPDYYKLTATPANKLAKGIALYVTTEGQDPEHIITYPMPIGDTVHFAVPLADVPVGTYTFTCYPVIGEDLGLVSNGVELVIPEPEPEPEPEPDPEPNP